MKANKGVGQTKSTAVSVTPIGTSTNTSTDTDSCFKLSNASPHKLQLITEIW